MVTNIHYLNKALEKAWPALKLQYGSGLLASLAQIKGTFTATEAVIKGLEAPRFTKYDNIPGTDDLLVGLRIPGANDIEITLRGYLGDQPVDLKLNLSVELEMTIKNGAGSGDLLPTVSGASVNLGAKLKLRNTLTGASDTIQFHSAIYRGANAQIAELFSGVKLVLTLERVDGSDPKRPGPMLTLLLANVPIELLPRDPIIAELFDSMATTGQLPAPYAQNEAPFIASSWDTPSNDALRETVLSYAKAAQESPIDLVADQLFRGSVRSGQLVSPILLVHVLAHTEVRGEREPLVKVVQKKLGTGLMNQVKQADDSGQVSGVLKTALEQAFLSLIPHPIWNAAAFTAKVKAALSSEAQQSLENSFSPQETAPQGPVLEQFNVWVLDDLFGEAYKQVIRVNDVEDSAIWTGHYLAAEALHFAVANRDGIALDDAAEAMQNVRWALERISRLVDLPRAALPTAQPQTGEGAQLNPNELRSLDGMICRAAIPVGAAKLPVIDFAHPPASVATEYYRDPVNLGGTSYVAYGRDTNGPSMDQILGVALGLTATFRLLDQAFDAERKLAAQLLVRIVNWLLEAGWNIQTPTGILRTDVGPQLGSNRDTFAHWFGRQFALLAAAEKAEKLLNGGTSGPLTEKYLEAAVSMGHAVWFTAWTNLFTADGDHYFKFNLDHAALAMLGLCVDDAAGRALLDKYAAVERAGLKHHRNAYFNLVWVLTAKEDDRPVRLRSLAFDSGTVAQETKRLIDQTWTRQTRSLKHRLPSWETPTATTQILKEWVEDKKIKYNEKLMGFYAPAALAPHDRTYSGRDFLWQRGPFTISVVADDKMNGPWEIVVGDRTRVSPGVDLMLAYWLARFLKVPEVAEEHTVMAASREMDRIARLAAAAVSPPVQIQNWLTFFECLHQNLGEGLKRLNLPDFANVQVKVLGSNPEPLAGPFQHCYQQGGSIIVANWNTVQNLTFRDLPGRVTWLSIERVLLREILTVAEAAHPDFLDAIDDLGDGLRLLSMSSVLPESAFQDFVTSLSGTGFDFPWCMPSQLTSKLLVGEFIDLAVGRKAL